MHLHTTRGRSGPRPTPRAAWGSPTRVLGTVVLAAAVVAVPQAAHATVTSDLVANILTVSSDAADPIAVTCVGGQAKVNGADPGTGPAACSSVTGLQVFGGPGGNVIDLSGVDPTAFNFLPNVQVDAGAGDDTVTGSPLADLIVGGPDRDRIVAARGGDLVFGGVGDDVMVWNNGDGSDLMEGGVGADTVEVNGSGRRRRRVHRQPQRRTGALRPDQPGPVQPRHRHDRGARRQRQRRRRHDQGASRPGTADRPDDFTGGDGDDTLIGGDGDDTAGRLPRHRPHVRRAGATTAWSGTTATAPT